MEVNGTTFITANLTFDPLVTSHASIYVCQVVGPVPASTNIRVVVEGGINNITLLSLLLSCYFSASCHII